MATAEHPHQPLREAREDACTRISDKNLVDKIGRANSSPAKNTSARRHIFRLSVYGASCKNHVFSHLDRSTTFHPYTEHTAWCRIIYELLGFFVGYTRCGRHIAESHKRVQKAMSDKRVNDKSVMTSHFAHDCRACVVGH
jgi:hypothetical protein